MTESERFLYDQLSDSDNLDIVPGSQSGVSKGIQAALGRIVGNPPFKAQFDLQFTTRYYSQAVVGTPVAVLPAALPVAQQTQVPLFLFGKSDMASNYKRIRENTILSGWNLGGMAIFTGGNAEADTIRIVNVDHALGTIVNGLLLPGDILLATPMAGWVAGAAATTIIAETVIRCPQVGYATLIDSLSSDVVQTNMIRYVVDPTLTNQLQNTITVLSQSLFGKATTDQVSPGTYINGNTFNRNIADIPPSVVLDKNKVMGTLINFDATFFNWVVTSNYFEKLSIGGLKA